MQENSVQIHVDYQYLPCNNLTLQGPKTILIHAQSSDIPLNVYKELDRSPSLTYFFLNEEQYRKDINNIHCSLEEQSMYLINTKRAKVNQQNVVGIETIPDNLHTFEDNDIIDCLRCSALVELGSRQDASGRQKRHSKSQAYGAFDAGFLSQFFFFLERQFRLSICTYKIIVNGTQSSFYSL